MNQGGPRTRACYLLCCLPQRVLRALAHRQQGYLNCAVLVVKPHLQKPTRPIVGQKKNTSSVIKEGWECGREPLASVAASYIVWFEILPWEKKIIQNPDFHPPTEHTRKASLVSYVGGNPRDAVSVVCQADADNSDTWAVLLQRMHAGSIRVLPPSVGVGKNHSHDPKGGSLVVAVDRQVLRPYEGNTYNINCIY